MNILSTHSGDLLYLSAFGILVRRLKFSWKQNICIVIGALLYAKTITTIQNVGNSTLRYGFLVLFIAAFIRYYILLGDRQRNITIRNPNDKCSLGVFMGSGGHTAEMKALISSLDFQRYTPRTYVYCHGDEMSLRIISELESSSDPSNHKLLALPRARKVGEGRISTLFSATKTLIITTWHTLLVPLYHNPMKPWVDVLILNGPGTAVILVAVAWLRRFVGLPGTQVIYVESFARTDSLSLSGKMLKSFVDVFVVQWPNAAGPSSTANSQESGAPAGERDHRVVHRGWLV